MTGKHRPNSHKKNQQLVRDESTSCGDAAMKDIELAPLVTTSSLGVSVLRHCSEHGGKKQPSASRLDKGIGVFSNDSNGKILSACAMYSFCSVSMVLTNKSLASSYNHLIDGDLNVLLVVFQAAVAVLCAETCKRLHWIDYPGLSFDTARQWAPVNLFFCAMLFTGMTSLQHNSVPMVTIFKNITNILVTFGDYALFGSTTELLVLVAFGIMLSGAIAAAWNDIYITTLGLGWMVLNCLSTAGYVLYMKFATKHVSLSKFGMVFVNNILCIVFLFPASLCLGQTAVLRAAPTVHSWDYFVKNLFAGGVGFLLNFASLNCVAVTGPTTYAIIGSLNKVPVAMFGYLLFDNMITRETWFFISVSMAGGFLYSYAKIKSRRSVLLANAVPREQLNR